jgi:hypothetical protein
VSGLNLLFETSIDYERTHQIALFSILKNSNLVNYLLGIETDNVRITWEPIKRLFDLGVETDSEKCFIEIKMWSSLYEDQWKRQNEYLNKFNNKCLYVLLGTSWFEYDNNTFSETFGTKCTKIGYKELIEALNSVLLFPGNKTDITELALAYRDAINKQYDYVINAYKYPKMNRVYFYSLYHKLKGYLTEIPFSIYGTNNAGGQVSILNNGNWHKVLINNIETSIFSELVNGELCFKFKAFVESYDFKNHENKYRIRVILRDLLSKMAEDKFNLYNTGRLGEYMTICKVKHDFTNLDNLEKSVEIIKGADILLKKSADSLAQTAL